MPRARTLQAAFNAGELDPRLVSRTDLKKYYLALQQARDVLLLPQGGVRRRPGLRDCAALGSAGIGHQILPFAFDIDQTYVIALLPGEFSVFRPDGTLLATVTGMAWTGVQAQEMHPTQSADTLLLFHPELAPTRIRRGTDDSVWTADNPGFTNLPCSPFDRTAYFFGIRAQPDLSYTPWNGIGVQPAYSYNATQPQDGVIYLQIDPSGGSDVFTTDHVGWQVAHSDGRARITRVITARQVQAYTLTQFTDGNFWLDWFLEEPIMSTSRGWPGCGTFHQGRLFMGGFQSLPATLAGSVVGDFFNFEGRTALADRGVAATIDSDQVNPICNIVSARNLQVLTEGSELAFTGAPPITPANFFVAEQTRRGSKPHVRTAEIDGGTLFIQRNGAALRQFIYEDIVASWKSEMVSQLAPHLIRDPVDMAARKAAKQDDADYVLLVNSDGTVAVLNTLREQEIAGFSLMSTAGLVKNTAVLLSGEVFFTIERAGLLRLEVWDEAALTDAALIASGASSGPITGLDRLNGLTVAIVLDGILAGTATVASGSVALPRPAATSVEIGLPFTPTVETMPPEPGQPDGTAIGRRTRIISATARLYQTGAFLMNGVVMAPRQMGDAMDAAPPLLTGDVRQRGMVGWQPRPTILIQQPDPAPFTLLGLALEVNSGP